MICLSIHTFEFQMMWSGVEDTRTGFVEDMMYTKSMTIHGEIVETHAIPWESHGNPMGIPWESKIYHRESMGIHGIPREIHVNP